MRAAESKCDSSFVVQRLESTQKEPTKMQVKRIFIQKIVLFFVRVVYRLCMCILEKISKRESKTNDWIRLVRLCIYTYIYKYTVRLLCMLFNVCC